MKTQRRILAILAGVAVAIVAGVLTLVMLMGTTAGLVTAAGVGVAVLVMYRFVIGPWHRRWGATAVEATAALPGDEIIPDAMTTTRAIGVAAPASELWPWLVQLGYGRAGWYSYDWIDNDGKPSAERILPLYQDLRPGDQILMMPGMGPRVRAVLHDEVLLVGDASAGTWCLRLVAHGDSTRLISRWRMPRPTTLVGWLWMTVADPGAFIMERKMLKNLKARAERSAPAGAESTQRTHAGTAS